MANRLDLVPHAQAQLMINAAMVFNFLDGTIAVFDGEQPIAQVFSNRDTTQSSLYYDLPPLDKSAPLWEIIANQAESVLTAMNMIQAELTIYPQAT